MAAMNEAEVTLTILAGGRGERMGKPKSLLRIANQPILTYLLKQFAWRGPTMLVTSPGREHPPGSERFDLEVVDPIEGMGPVRGLMTALDNSKTENLILASVDMPLIAKKQLLWLLQKMQERPQARGLMIQRAAIEPFPSIFRRTLPGLDLKDQHSMRSLTSIEGFSVLPAPENWPADIWTNLNDRADFAAFEKLMACRNR